MTIPGFFWSVLWFFLGVLVAYAWLSMRRRIRKSIEVPPPRIDQDDIRRIEEKGSEFSKSNELKLSALGVPMVPLSFWRRGASLRHFTRGLELRS